jgi:hypothetical protein
MMLNWIPSMDKKYGSFKVHKCWKGVRINYDVDVINDTEISEFDLDEQFNNIQQQL